MASKYWLKLFHETIYDPKVMMRSPGARLRWYECLCLAGDYDKEGELPSIEHMVFVFRVTEEQLLDELSELIRAGLMVKEGDVYIVKNWSKRQGFMDTNERSQRYRETKQKKEYYEPATDMQRTCNESATNRDADIDIDIDKDIDTDKEEDELISQFASISGIKFIPKNLKEQSEWKETLITLKKSGVTPDIMARACEGRKINNPQQIIADCGRLLKVTT